MLIVITTAGLLLFHEFDDSEMCKLAAKTIRLSSQISKAFCIVPDEDPEHENSWKTEE